MNIEFKKIGPNKYQLSKTAQMRVEAVVYSTPELLKTISQDLSLKQLQEAASLPQVVSPVIGMPDIHQGFGLPIGGVMATQGLISVGAVGMDINCGVRLLSSGLSYNQKDFSSEKLKKLVKQIEKLIPLGLGKKHKKSYHLDLKKITEEGVKYLVNRQYALPQDLARIEENGQMKEANFQALTPKAKKRAQN